MYKPLFLALVTTLVCISVWLLVLTLTGKRRDKLRRLLRREMFITELETECATSQVRPSYRHTVKLSHIHTVTYSHRHTVTQSHCYTVT